MCMMLSGYSVVSPHRFISSRYSHRAYRQTVHHLRESIHIFVMISLETLSILEILLCPRLQKTSMQRYAYKMSLVQRVTQRVIALCASAVRFLKWSLCLGDLPIAIHDKIL